MIGYWVFLPSLCDISQAPWILPSMNFLPMSLLEWWHSALIFRLTHPNPSCSLHYVALTNSTCKFHCNRVYSLSFLLKILGPTIHLSKAYWTLPSSQLLHQISMPSTHHAFHLVVFLWIFWTSHLSVMSYHYKFSFCLNFNDFLVCVGGEIPLVRPRSYFWLNSKEWSLAALKGSYFAPVI